MKKMSNVEIKRGNTAIARQKMSRPMKKMYESGKFTSAANSLRVFPVYSSSLSTFFQKLIN